MTKEWYEERGKELTTDIRRVADALEEVLRLVKKDQEEAKKRWEKEDDKILSSTDTDSLGGCIW